MKRIIYLTENEEKALRLLASGLSSKAVQSQCVIPASGFAFFTMEIRRKTGIFDTRTPLFCAEYLKRYEDNFGTGSFSVQQVNAVRRLLAGETMESIANNARIEFAAVEALLRDARQTACIFTRDGRAIASQLRIYMAVFHSANPRPLSLLQTRVLPMLAAGESYDSIADQTDNKESYIRFVVKDACMRLGLNARGKGAQRQLIRAWLEVGAVAPVTMDDPAF